uniref:Uncharacterized protein n=1 Tax=Ananas comosus var. bracteatus TaxID=296719 RepID=A0A6V7Q3R2_ANACO|nr:unnamed protein product [Ananas comosus var. bracteatus]
MFGLRITSGLIVQGPKPLRKSKSDFRSVRSHRLHNRETFVRYVQVGTSTRRRYSGARSVTFLPPFLFTLLIIYIAYHIILVLLYSVISMLSDVAGPSGTAGEERV